MAMSFSHPDPSSPASVAEASFPTGRRGFAKGDVRDFLRMVAAELGRLQERERFLERELRTAQSSPDLSSAALDDDDLGRLLGEETARVISTARESATEIRSKAEQAAARMVSEASDEAKRLREAAELEASRHRADAASDAEAEIGMAKQQGREMVNEARAYRERVLSELARRRELAREQIEQLVRGRDRLMQSFERARLVAVDVVAELRPLGEPDEYVNLAPTTGPVPVMVPNEARVDDEHTAAFDAFDRAAEADDLPEVPENRDAESQSDAEASPGDGVHESPDGAVTESTEAEAADAEAADAEAAAPGAAGSEVTADRSTIDEIWADDPATARAGEPVPAGSDDEAGDDSTEPAATEAGDDVVVDLFARIRADSAPDGSDTDDHDQSDAEASAEPASEEPDSEETDSEPTASEEPDSEPTDSAGSDSEAIDGPATPFELRDENLTPLIVASAKKLKRVLADEQNEVLDQLRRAKNVGGIDDLLPPVGEHVSRYTQVIADDLKAAAQAGATSASGTKRKLRAATSKLALSQAGAVLEEFLVMPLRERLERAVSDGAGDGEAATKATRAVYREWKTRYIDERLDDVMRAAHGRGRLGGFKAGTEVVWTVDPSGPACPDCDDNVLGGVVEVGSEFPTGDTYAPAHPGCRCLLTPVDG